MLRGSWVVCANVREITGVVVVSTARAAQQIAQGDCLPLGFMKLFAPAVLTLACSLFCWPGSALTQKSAIRRFITDKNQLHLPEF
jgi:hypothetical protein